MRIFYENNEKLNYWLYQEDVYEEMKKDSYWSEYTIEQCQQDLASLVEWKNLNTMQDTKKVASIEEFKNKKYRYQISEYSVQIERLVLRLENLLVEGASLEPTLLERIRRNIEKFAQMVEEEQVEVNAWWNDLNSDFVRLNQNYQDYIRDLNSVRAEEMMHTKEFMVFKDRLIEYLRSFIKGLQRNVGVIEEYLRLLDEETKKQIFEKVAAYQFAIPRMDIELSKKQIEENVIGRFQSIYNWFVATEGHENEAATLFDATNEIIRRITRYAAELSEKNSLGANRKEEYKKVAELFMKCEDVDEAHKMSAMVFGIERPVHISGDYDKAKKRDGFEHQGMSGFFTEKNMVQVPLNIIAEWESIECIDHEIYIVENPSVFAAICRDKSCMCMNGQPRLASILVLDLLAKSNVKIYYSGDLDPEGLLIAQKLRQYYKGDFFYWHMEIEDYRNGISQEVISDKRKKILDRIKDEELLSVANLMKEYGVAGYQENILEKFKEIKCTQV